MSATLDRAVLRRRATCSHVWKDRRYIKQFVLNNPVAPWQMETGQTYECCNCHALAQINPTANRVKP